MKKRNLENLVTANPYNMDTFPHWADHIVAFLFCVLLPFYSIKQTLNQNTPVVYDSLQKKAFYFSTCFSLFIMAAIILTVWLLFGRPLRELGFTFDIDIRSSVWPVLAFVVVYSIDTIYSVASPKNLAASRNEWQKRAPFMPTKMEEFPSYAIMCLCAGVFEEIVYRGYLVTYFQYLFSASDYQQILSIVLPALIFAISHFYHGAKNVIKAFVLSAFLVLIFIQSRSLVIVMILHFLINVIGGLLTIKYLREESKA